MFDPKLTKYIARGTCFALVGSGPSTEKGYPSWRKLAADVFMQMKKSGKLSDEAGCQKYLSMGKYPEFFSVAERDLGGREQLVSLLKELLVAKPLQNGNIYSILARWPIPVYLTTNWDDEIVAALKRTKIYFKTFGNTKTDFSKWRADTNNVVVKLHSDLNNPETAVITSSDYQAFSTGPAFDYFRSKLRAIFEMFNVFIVGHSLADSDLSLVLQIAKDSASPEHPIYLIAADMTVSEEIELFQKYNINVISYKNPDGSHKRLRKMLHVVDKFITPRQRRLEFNEVASTPDEIEAVQGLLIYRRIHKMTEADDSKTAAHHFEPLVLRALLQAEEGGITLEDLFSLPPLSLLVNNAAIKTAIASTLEALREDGLLKTGARIALSKLGTERASEMRDRRALEEEQAYGQFLIDLHNELGKEPEKPDNFFVDLLKDTVVKVFKQRGLAIANSIFAGRSVSEQELTDVFFAFSNAAASVDEETGVAFVSAAQKFVLEPSEVQLKYLTSLSQGFFLFHLLGLDPTCAKIRKNILQHTVWWCDASTLLPLIARGSQNHEYAKDLFRRLRGLNVTVTTTTKFLWEVHRHVSWAIKLFQEEDTTSQVFLQAALLKGSFKQNLFLEGYIRLAADGATGTPTDYFNSVLPGGQDESDVRRALEEMGIFVVDVRELEGYKVEDRGSIAELSHLVREERIQSETYKGEKQIEAEGEVLHIIRALRNGQYKSPVAAPSDRTFFLSQSLVLDRVANKNEGVTWTPEALYRYLIALPGGDVETGLLHQCMLQEFYGAGAILIDKERYSRFFGPAIDAAKASFVTEEKEYLKEFPTKSVEALRSSFKNTPDLEKPFFVTQMGWKAARAASIRAEVAALRVTAMEAELREVRANTEVDSLKKQLARTKQAAAEERHKQDPKYLKKRLRQAKRRNRKAKH